MYSSRSLLLTFSLSMAIISGSYAHEPEKVQDNLIFQASRIPDRIVLNLTSNPKTSIAMNWRTDARDFPAFVEYAIASDGPQDLKSLTRIVAHSEKFESKAGKVAFHSATLINLKPSTVYCYRVGDGVNWSELFQFQTEHESSKAFQFLYFGDAQNDIKMHWSRVIRQAQRDASKSSFMLHAGDLINTHLNDHEWGEWFGAGGFLNAMIPAFVTPGNHEYARGPDGKPALTPHWRPQFNLPLNGLKGLEETNYFIDYSNARIISLNSNEQQEVQAIWLDELLSQKNRPLWTIITFHHPVYSVSKGRDSTKLRVLWQPIFDKHHVDLVLNGHDHTYARSGPRIHDNRPAGEQVRRNESGTVYVVSVSGPKMYDLNDQEWMLRRAEFTQLYQIISVDGDRLDFQSRTAVGNLYDQFQMRKISVSKAAEFIDLQPLTPERRKHASSTNEKTVKNQETAQSPK